MSWLSVCWWHSISAENLSSNRGSHSPNSPVSRKTTSPGAVTGRWTCETSILRPSFFASSQMSLNPWKDWPGCKSLELTLLVDHEVICWELRNEDSLSVHSLVAFCLLASGMVCLVFSDGWVSLRLARKKSLASVRSDACLDTLSANEWPLSTILL